jgi:hypothetical protein
LGTKVKKIQGKKLQFLWRGFIFAIVSAFLLVAILLAMLDKEPKGFASAQAYGKTAQVSPYLTHYLAPNVHNNIQLDQPFEIVVPQKGLNEIIAEDDLLGWNWPVVLNSVTFSRPVAVFDARKILLMGKIDVIGFDTVITICATPTLDEHGLLSLNLQYVRAGMLDISFLAKKTAKRVIESQLGEVEEQYWLKNLLGACLDNTPFEPIFPTGYDRHIKLIKSEISENKLILVFEPSSRNEIADTVSQGNDLANVE